MTTPRDTLESAFNERSTTYNINSWHVQYAERLVELAHPSPGMQILDAATGTGFAAFAAARHTGPTGHVLGVDISAGMLARARETITARGLTNIDLIKADAAALPQVADGSFDLVLCSAALLYIPIQPALREWLRLLKPGGLVGFSTMKVGFPAAARLFRELASHHGLALIDPATPLGTPDRCRQELRTAGFVPTDLVEGTVRFSRTELEHAWQAHTLGPHHAAVAALTNDQRERFRVEYASTLTDLLDRSADRLLDAGVMYAFGRKPSQ